MALRGGSNLLRSIARLTNSHVASSSRISTARREQPDYSVLTHNISNVVGGIRMFSTTPRKLNTAAELTNALESEIVAEKELQNETGGYKAAFPGFTLTTNEAEVRLTKKHGNEDILVVFNVSHSVEIPEESDGNAAPAPVALPPFSIEITKGGERLCFHLELIEGERPGDYDFQVEEFYIAPAAKGPEEEVPSHVYATSGKYIDDNIQQLLYVNYLEERGFDDSFLRNLVTFASAHEHHLYINFLNKMKSFIGK